MGLSQQFDFMEEKDALSNQIVHCRVTDWTTFTPCTKTCGTGIQKRTRAIAVLPAFGGSACPHLVETRHCATRPCPPASEAADCQVGSWQPWTTCTHTCGGGIQV